MCQVTVEIAGVEYPVTVLRDTKAQLSLFRNTSGKRKASWKAVLCWWINAVEKFAIVKVKLTCRLVTTEARVALAENLSV